MTEIKKTEAVGFVDAHCHLTDSKWMGQIELILQRSRQVGISSWIQGGICPEEWQKQKELRLSFGSGVIPVFGLHPWWVVQHDKQKVEEAFILLEKEIGEAFAVGEAGLDLSPKHSSAESLFLQEYAFEKHLEISKKYSKPLVLHIVRAHPQAISLLKKWGPFPQGGIIHAFSGSREIAEQYMKLGFLISIGDAIVKEGFQKLKRAIPYLLLEKIVVETDLEEPERLIEIAKEVGRIRQVDFYSILNQSRKNLEKLFGLECFQEARL